MKPGTDGSYACGLHDSSDPTSPTWAGDDPVPAETESEPHRPSAIRSSDRAVEACQVEEASAGSGLVKERCC